MIPEPYDIKMVDCCDLNEGRPCVYETSDAEQGCEIFRGILREIEAEMEVING